MRLVSFVLLWFDNGILGEVLIVTDTDTLETTPDAADVRAVETFGRSEAAIECLADGEELVEDDVERYEERYHESFGVKVSGGVRLFLHFDRRQNSTVELMSPISGCWQMWTKVYMRTCMWLYGAWQRMRRALTCQ